MSVTDLGILIEFIRSDVVDRENDLNIASLGLLYERGDLLRARSIEKRLANLEPRNSAFVSTVE